MKVTDWPHTFTHFEPEEFFSPGGLDLFFKKNVIPCDLLVMHCLESFRHKLNMARELEEIESDKEITLQINSYDQRLRGFVTPEEWVHERPKKEGQTFSFHLWCAADISSAEVPPEVLFKYATMHVTSNTAFFNGIIEYDWGLHVDMRRGQQYIKGLT